MMDSSEIITQHKRSFALHIFYRQLIMIGKVFKQGNTRFFAVVFRVECKLGGCIEIQMLLSSANKGCVGQLPKRRISSNQPEETVPCCQRISLCYRIVEIIPFKT